jgi:o-succinylbenzoate---CoA ligase
VIEWLHRIDPSRTFLTAGLHSWTYGDLLVEVGDRLTDEHRVVRPELTPGSVFDVVAGIAGGGVILAPPGDGPDPAPETRLVVYTSGSTGPPKGVRLTMGNLEAAASASARHLGHDADDDWLLAMPLHHVGGLSILVRQIYMGGSVTMLPRFEADAFTTAMRGRVTMVSVVPTMLRRILPGAPFPGLRAVLVGGGPIPDGLLEEASSLGIPVLPTYGMTETFGQAATLLPGSPVARRAHPLPGVDFVVTEDGRIAIRGDQVSPGYLGQPDREDEWFVTNDLGEIDADGAVSVLGRADTIIISGGENVSPEAVEAVIGQHPQVGDVTVVGVPDEEWGEMVVAFYVGIADTSELASWCADRMTGYMVPRRWVRMEALPRLDLGKPDRAAMRAIASG